MALLPAITFPAVVFEDDFENREYSTRNWSFQSADQCVLQVNDGSAFIQNNSESYSALAVHRSKNKIPQFTFSAKVMSDYPGSGIFFCFQEKGNGFGGYAALLSDDMVYIYKFYPESTSVITGCKSAFVKEKENRLSVSKSNDVISVFCNGYYLCSVRDSTYLTGDVALIVPPLAESSFDNIKVENSYADTLIFDEFLDDFKTQSEFGWKLYGYASESWENSHLQIHTTSFQQYYNGIEIPMDMFSMKTSVRFIEGDSCSVYGLFLKVADGPGKPDKFCEFVISGNKKYMAFKDSLHDSKLFNGVSEYINGSGNNKLYDTLMLKRNGDTCIFSANGIELGKTNGISGIITGAGLYVSNDMKIAYDYFHISGSLIQTASYNKKIIRNYTVIRNSNKSEETVDFLGRCINTRKNFFSAGIVFTEKQGLWEKRFKLRKGERLR